MLALFKREVIITLLLFQLALMALLVAVKVDPIVSYETLRLQFNPVTWSVGEEIPNLSVYDNQGHYHKLHSLIHRNTVLLFSSCGCEMEKVHALIHNSPVLDPKISDSLGILYASPAELQKRRQELPSIQNLYGVSANDFLQLHVKPSPMLVYVNAQHQVISVEREASR